ncbi:MAG: tRNA pseudouridine(38-40) synthase TruA [Cytophagales bacterium]|nr:tRNA pseudouridine(38-40) synthase TruA [Cytophagales bacterium]
MRYFFEISYKGTNYHGWQIQQNALSIQQVIQDRLKQLLKANVEVVGSGRTDAGVHAKQQFFHTDVEMKLDCFDFAYHMNAILPRDISILSIKKVIPEAHARFDAISRGYDYVMISQKNPFVIDEAYIYHRSIDLERLNAAAQLFLGKHNFKSFSKVKTQVNNFICEVTDAGWRKDKDRFIFHIEANRFLRGMVRAIVGTLLLVNENKLSIESLNEILSKKDRRAAGRAVPPEGLYLCKVCYPSEIFEI